VRWGKKDGGAAENAITIGFYCSSNITFIRIENSCLLAVRGRDQLRNGNKLTSVRRKSKVLRQVLCSLFFSSDFAQKRFRETNQKFSAFLKYA
jgi:hypothetical protein